jgi:hypothetical protein
MFYTILFGQIGAFVLVVDFEVDFKLLGLAKLLTATRCTVEFGLTLGDSHRSEMLNVVSTDMLDFIE